MFSIISSILFLIFQFIVLIGITFAVLDDDVDASVFHISPEDIKTYIKKKDSDQFVLKNKAEEDKGTYLLLLVVIDIALLNYTLMCFTALCCSMLSCAVLCCTVLQCPVLYFTILFIMLYYTILHCTTH